jgi:Trk K+ transport system NAD-binding subunit
MSGFAILLVLFVLILIAAVALMNVRYEAPGGRRDLDLAESIYAVFTLLFFGGGYSWPQDAITRAIFFLVPLVGMAVVGQTTLGLASALVNRQRWEVAVASTFENHVIVCGLGKVGIRVVTWLREMGQDVVVIEADQNHRRLREVSSWKIPVIFGDGSYAKVLEEANLMTAESIVPCTSDDLANLSIATAARAMRPGIRVVLRTFDDNLAANVKAGFDIHYAYSTSALAAPAFAAAALQAPVDYAFSFGEDKMLLTITEFVLVEESPLAGLTVGKIEDDFDVEFLAVRDAESKLNPPDGFVLEPGCRFVVSATLDAITRLAKLTPSAREYARYEKGTWHGGEPL